MKVSFDLQFKRFLNLWYKAEKRRDKRAQYTLALLYLKCKRPNTLVHAFQLLKKSAKQNFTDAAYMVAYCYHQGVGIRRDYRRAIRWYIETDRCVTYDIWNNPSFTDKLERAAVQKYLAEKAYAESVDEAWDVEKDRENLENMLETALSGNSSAQMRLAHAYYFGQEVEKDIQKAIYWYRKSAERGNDGAMARLAEIYNEAGQYKEAAEWYRKYIEERIKWRNERLGW